MSSNYRLDTKTGLDNLEPRHAVYWQKLSSGSHIGYRKTETGGSWHVRFTDHNNVNKRSQKSLGSDIDFDQASDLAREFCKSKDAGVDHTYTVRQAIDAYLEHRTINKNHVSAQKARYGLYKHIRKSLMNRPVAELNKGELRRWSNSLIAGGHHKPMKKGSANRVIADFVAALNLCFDDGTVQDSRAWQKLKFKVAASESRRDVFFSPEQEQTLLSLCDDHFRPMVEAALLTGARPTGELRNLRVQDFDAEKGTLKITADAIGTGKTGARVMQLSDKAVAFFKAQARGKLPKAWLISKPNGDAWGEQDHSSPWRTVLRRSLQLPKAKRIPQNAVMYACRHTYISRMVLQGVPMLGIAQNCGTSVQMIQDHYGHFAEQDLRAMLNRAEA